MWAAVGVVTAVLALADAAKQPHILLIVADDVRPLPLHFGWVAVSSTHCHRLSTASGPRALPFLPCPLASPHDASTTLSVPCCVCRPC